MAAGSADAVSISRRTNAIPAYASRAKRKPGVSVVNIEKFLIYDGAGIHPRLHFVNSYSVQSFAAVNRPAYGVQTGVSAAAQGAY